MELKKYSFFCTQLLLDLKVAMNLLASVLMCYI